MMRMGGGKGKGVTTLLIGILVLLVAGLAGYIIMTRNTPQAELEPETGKRSVLVTEENANELAASQKASDKPVVRSYVVQMNSDWHFPDGKSQSDNAYVANSASNEWPVWFSVTLSDGRTVYESPILPVDTHIGNFALMEDLEAGSYSGSVTYHVVDDDQNELTSLSVGVTITVDG